MPITTLITGANSGIGKEVALALAKLNHQVIMVCRDEKKGRAALAEIKASSGSANIDLLIADLSSQTSIKTLAKTVRERYPALHVLINNAGIVTTEKMLSVDGIEMTLATNYLGPLLLTELLVDLLKSSAPARVINVSSAAHTWGVLDLNDLEFEHREFKFMRAYAQSKLLMNIASFELARRLEGTGVTVNCLHPGAVNTHLGSSNAHSLPMRLLDKLIKLFLMSPQKAAKTPIYLATSTAVETITGQYFVKCKPVKASAPCYDLALALRVWEVSHQLLGRSVIPVPAKSIQE